MKICYLNHDLKNSTGAGNFCLSFTRALSKLNPFWNISILTSDDVLSGGVFSLSFKYFKIRNIFKKFDIIHALDGWPYGFIAVACSLGLNKKIFITAIGSGAVRPLYSPVKKQLLNWAYKKANKVVAISSHTKQEILKVISGLKIEVINHGVDYGKFQIQNPKSQIHYGIINYKPYILSVGTLKKRKGFEYSIRAFAEVADKFPQLKYVIVGKGPEKQKLESLINNYQLQNKVIFLDNLTREKLVSLYKDAELFILLPQDDNKDIEGFGLVFLEAAACGLPVIGSKDSSVEDAVLVGKNGFLVESQNYKQVAEVMANIIQDKEFREKLSKNSIDFAKSMTWDKVVKNYADNIYNQL